MYYEPLHTIPALRDTLAVEGSLEETDRLADSLLCLPMANDLSERGDRSDRAALRQLDASPH